MSANRFLRIEQVTDEGKLPITSETGFFIGEDQLQGIESADIEFRPGEVVRAKLTLFAFPQLRADAVFLLAHPKTGERKQVKKIVWADGDEFEC